MKTKFALSVVLLLSFYIDAVTAEPSWFWESDESNSIEDEADFRLEFYGKDLSGEPQLRANASHGMESAVSQMRHWLREEVNLNPDLYAPLDVARLMSGLDWHVTRYLQDFKRAPTVQDLQDRFEQLKSNLAWRHEWRISDPTKMAEQFPCEFFLTGEHHVSHGRDGKLVFIWEPSRMMKYAGKFHHDYSRFMYSLYDAVDTAANLDTWSAMVTFGKMGFATIPTHETIQTFYPTMDLFPGKFRQLSVVDLAPELSPVINIIRQMSPRRMRETVKFYLGEYDKYLIVKKRDTPKFMGGRLPVSKSLLAFLPQADRPLDACIGMKQAANLNDWPRDQVDLFLQYNRMEIKRIATAVGFPLEKLTLDMD